MLLSALITLYETCKACSCGSSVTVTSMVWLGSFAFSTRTALLFTVLLNVLKMETAVQPVAAKQASAHACLFRFPLRKYSYYKIRTGKYKKENRNIRWFDF